MRGVRPPGPTSWRSAEALAAAVLAVLAALRVGLFAAAFPFYSNVDEHRHIDAVLKYARGYWPAPGTDAYEPEMATLLGVYGSPEYHASDAATSGAIDPPWVGDPARMVKMIEWNERFLAGRPNLEAFQPPLYYATAAVWLKLGRLTGLEGGRLIYWVRQLNALGMLALVFGSWWFLRGAYPGGGERFVRLGVPALLAVFPQDLLYYVTRDSFSPLFGAAGLFAAVTLARRPGARLGVYALAGVAGAAAFLAKYTNAVVLVLYAAVTAASLYRARPRPAAKLACLWACALVPIVLWLAHNQLAFGEWLATGVKVERLGWGRKTFVEMWDHPILTPGGLAIFVGELFPTFWRGELVWHRVVLAQPFADAFYTASSLVLLAFATLGIVRAPDADARRCDALSLLAVVTAGGVLALLSMLFVFGPATNPTADNPYLSQGRLVACALVPFTILYVRGIGVAVSPLPARFRPIASWTALALAIAVVIASEATLSTQVFASPYNWFHFP